jgi:aminoglycoside phosphotransferase (APT) family kinase protein
VGDEVVLESGLRVWVEEFPAQGSKHETLFGTLHPHQRAVVVKVEGVHGALEREAAALRHLAALRGPVPTLIEVGVGTWRGKRSVCLVMERKAGCSPTTRERWRRMGRALGRVGRPVDRVAGLPVLDYRRFGADHAQRIRELETRLIGLGSVVPDWPLLCSAHIPTPGPLVLTHGDPGPGNFLTTVATAG